MTTQDLSITSPQPDKKRKQVQPRKGITRLLLCILLIMLFFVFFKNSDVLQILGGFFTILGINVFEPVFSSIDRCDPFIWRFFLLLWSLVNRLMLFHLPVIGRGIKRRSNSIIVFSCVGALAFLLFHTIVANAVSTISDFSCLRTPLPIPSALCNSGVGITTLSDGVRIGLITNASQGPFDQSSNNMEEKQIEALLDQENRTACSGSHVTVALVTLLSRTIEDPNSSASKGLEDLRGMYLAQHDYNVTKAAYDPNLHQGRPFVNLCVVLANLGTLVTADQENTSDLYSLPQVVKQLVQFNRYDSTFRGLIGFPYSAQAEEAIHEFPKWWGNLSIPIISPSATSYKLSNVPNFYRVSSPDDSQAMAMQLFVCKTLLQVGKTASVDIFTNSDPYSSSLSSKFKGDISTCIGSDHIHYEAYVNGDAASIQKATQNAVQQGYSFIFFPGYESDLDTLQAQIQSNALSSTASQNSSHITILGGDGLVDIVNPNHNTFATLYSTVYATPLKSSDPVSKQFIQEYVHNKFPIPYLANVIPGYSLLSQGVIRSYNAVKAFTSTLNDLADRNLDTTQENITTHLAAITFNGIAGQFGFQGDAINSGHISDPQSSFVYIMCTNRDRGIRLVATYDGRNLVPIQDKCS